MKLTAEGNRAATLPETLTSRKPATLQPSLICLNRDGSMSTAWCNRRMQQNIDEHAAKAMGTLRSIYCYQSLVSRQTTPKI